MGQRAHRHGVQDALARRGARRGIPPGPASRQHGPVPRGPLSRRSARPRVARCRVGDGGRAAHAQGGGAPQRASGLRRQRLRAAAHRARPLRRRGLASASGPRRRSEPLAHIHGLRRHQCARQPSARNSPPCGLSKLEPDRPPRIPPLFSPQSSRAPASSTRQPPR